MNTRPSVEYSAINRWLWSNTNIKKIFLFATVAFIPCTSTTMNPEENIHNAHLNDSNGNPPVVVAADPAESDEIVEIPPHLSDRMWDSFKTYMLYPFMIAVAGSFGLSIGYALYDRAAAASTNINLSFINFAALKQRLRWQ